MTLERNVTLHKNLRMLLPRAEAQKLLEGVIAEGKSLHRKRTPKKLNGSAPKAVEVTKQIRAWVTKSNKAMTQCFGEQGAGAIRKIPLRYSSLDAAKERIRLRLDLLIQAFERTKTLRKTSARNHPKPQQSRRETIKEKPKSNGTRHKYDFCLSFAGEDRSYAEKLKALLEERGAQVFYDSDYQHELWGENLSRTSTKFIGTKRGSVLCLYRRITRRKCGLTTNVYRHRRAHFLKGTTYSLSELMTRIFRGLGPLRDTWTCARNLLMR